ncbi:MAG: SRPBCC family protein [Chromatiales bacterium]|nr:MAG: SRPBCC family protein [Chromatiales bacterium]
MMNGERKAGLRRCPTVLLCLLLAAGDAVAVEVERIEVTRQGKIFRLEAESVVAAPRDFVFDILVDFDHFHRLVAGMVTTRYLPPDDDGVLVGYTLVHSCAWIFCTRFEKVERMWPVPTSEIVTIADPERSDFRFYTTRWHLEDTPGGTRLRFKAMMQPDFWVPPVIGPWAVKRKLDYTAREIGEVVEYLYATGTSLAELPATPGER